MDGSAAAKSNKMGGGPSAKPASPLGKQVLLRSFSVILDKGTNEMRACSCQGRLQLAVCICS